MARTTRGHGRFPVPTWIEHARTLAANAPRLFRQGSWYAGGASNLVVVVTGAAGVDQRGEISSSANVGLGSALVGEHQRLLLRSVAV
jgi:hypothetical protein